MGTSQLVIILSAATIGGTIVAVYMRLSLADYVIKVLNSRYVTKELFIAETVLVENKLDNLIGKINSLPCCNYDDCKK